MGALISRLLFQPPSSPTPLHPNRYFFLTTESGLKFPAFFIRQPLARYTVLYSHGNAEDLGMIYSYLLELSRLLYINIMAYDYSGYGPKSISNMIQDVKPSEENCYENINAAYEYLITTENIRPQDVVLYGRSVGSGPSCYLAEKLCKYKENQIGGLILHSPFLSVVRVVLDMGLENSYDVFPNVSRVPNITCPTFIIHGTSDYIVPFHHGKGLYEALSGKSKYPPFWADNMGHNNIESEMASLFLKKLQMFFLHLLKRPRDNSKMKRNLRAAAFAMNSKQKSCLNNGTVKSDNELSLRKSNGGKHRKLERKSSPRSVKEFEEQENKKVETSEIQHWCRVSSHLDYGEIECSYVSTSISS